MWADIYRMNMIVKELKFLYFLLLFFVFGWDGMGMDRRAIICRRAVRVNSQLKSHKRFANAFTTYCNLVDVARLYSTNDLDGPAKVRTHT